MVFLTTTISLWVRPAEFVVAAADKTAVALDTSARKTTAAMRKRWNVLRRVPRVSSVSLTEFPPASSPGTEDHWAAPVCGNVTRRKRGHRPRRTPRAAYTRPWAQTPPRVR